MAGSLISSLINVAASQRWAASSVCLLISFLSPLHAEDLPDPTRPPASIFAPAGGAAREATGSQSSGLHTIIISGTRRAAIIDGQTVELGGEHGGARLIEVNEGSVVLQRGQGRQVLTLFPDVKLTRKESSDQESAEKKSPKKKPQVKQLSSASKAQSGKHKTGPTAHYEKLLMKPLAIPPGSQTTATKRLVMSGHPKEAK